MFCKFISSFKAVALILLRIFPHPLTFVALFFILPVSLFAQPKGVENLPKYDRQFIHFGFTLGINRTNFIIKPIPDFYKTDSLYVVESKPGLGFNLGIVTNLHLNDNWDLRFVPALSFADRKLLFSFVQKDTIINQSDKNIESTFLDFPIDLKFKSIKTRNFRMYLLGGFKYSLDLAGKENVNPNNTGTQPVFRIIGSDYGFEFGTGGDFYLEYFKFSLELKMYYGMNNLIEKDNTAYTTSIDKLLSKVFLLSFNFE